MREYFSTKTSVLAVTAALVLAACGNPGNNNYVPPETGVVTIPPTVTPPPVDPPPTGDGSPQGQAGAGFATAFNQGPTDEPVDPMTGDIVALDKTAEPIPIPDP